MRYIFMGKYVENNLGKNENVVKKAELNKLFLVGPVLSMIFIITIPSAIIKIVNFFNIELAITNKRIIGKVGLFKTQVLDAPLNKIQSVKVTQNFWGKIFNHGIINISTAAGEYNFAGIKNADAFKRMIMAQIDQYEEDRVKQQAEEMAKSMASVLNK